MSSVNKVILIGNLGKDPDIRATQSSNVATFSLATTETYTSNGQKETKTEWHNIVVWGNQALVASKYLTKGSKIYLEGRLQTRSWDDKSGNKRYTTEVVVTNFTMLGGGKNESNNQSFNKPTHETSWGDGVPF